MAPKNAVPVPARALVLTPMPEAGRTFSVAIELPDGTVRVTNLFVRACGLYSGVLVPGTRIPVTLANGDPAQAALAAEFVPADSEVAEVIGEALGGLKVAPRPPDDWRVRLALDYAERIIANAGLSESAADAIRQRIRLGV